MSSSKKHILILDDTLEGYLRRILSISGSEIFGNQEDIVCEVASNPAQADRIIKQWRTQGSEPDAICADYLFGEHKGPDVVADIVRELKTKPKLFIHSKSGLTSYSSPGEQSAQEKMADLGAEYFHTDEIWAVAAYLNSKRFSREEHLRTTNFREFVNTAFGLRVPAELGEAEKEKLEKAAAEKERLISGSLLVDDIWGKYFAREAKEDPAKDFSRLDVNAIRNDLRPSLDLQWQERSNGLPFKQYAAGAVSGHAAFSAEQVRSLRAEGRKPILILDQFKPDQLALLKEVAGVACMGNGSTHLRTNCEEFGIPCVSDFAFRDRPHQDLKATLSDAGLHLEDKKENYQNRKIETARNETIRYGDPISLDVREVIDFDRLREDSENRMITLGYLHTGTHPVKEPSLENYWYDDTRKLADQVRLYGWHRYDKRDCRGLNVKVNISTPEQIAAAIARGADGAGLARTENMLFEDERLGALRTVLTGEESLKSAALQTWRQWQEKDFEAVFRAAKASPHPFPLTIRLLDAKPTELLPAGARDTDSGERGVQYAKVHPEIYEAQLEAICSAASKTGAPALEIMVPFVKQAEDMDFVRALLEPIAEKYGLEDRVRLGAMMETKEAIKNSAAITRKSDFLSFGSNDLTTQILGMDRSDFEAIENWKNANIADSEGKTPFRALVKPVREAIRQAVAEARKVKPAIRISLCGDQVAFDDDSVCFCQSLDMDSISVSSRTQILVPTLFAAAKAAAQAKLEAKAQRSAPQGRIGSNPGETSSYQAMR